MRYRVIGSVRLRGRFRDIRFLKAVYSLSVRPMNARELSGATRLSRSDVAGLLAELGTRGVLRSEPSAAKAGWLGLAHARIARFLRGSAEPVESAVDFSLLSTILEDR